MFLLFFSFLFFVLFYIFLPRNKYFLGIFIVFSIIFSFFSLFFLIWNYYTWVWVDESVLYHLFLWFEWAWLWADLKIFFLWFWVLFFEIFLLFFALLKWKRTRKTRKREKLFLSILFFILSFIFHPILKNFYDLWYFSFSWSENNIFYETPKVSKKTEKTKNFIYIYLESFEKLYLDENIFPWVAKNLQEIKENSTFFENVEQAFSTNWTIAWMVWSQCGTPLINSGGWGNSMHWIADFLPGAFCLWDYLKKAWYELSYLWWADLSFAWKWNFYKTHGFQNVVWKKELQEKLLDKSYQNDWWLYDDVTFDLVFEEFDRLSKTWKNFWLFTLTLDTHWNDHILSKSCKEKNFDKKILNSFACSDFLLWKFLEKIKNHKNFENTVIVISSDHYAMKINETTDILEKNQEKRRNLFLIINWKKQKISKKWTTLDIWATILDEIGFNVKKFWYWISLFSDFESLENSILRQNKKTFEKFWDFPSIKNGIEFDLEKNKIYINWKNIWFPAVLLLNKQKDTEKIIWEDLVNWKLIDKKSENTIYMAFYTNWEFCLDFWLNSRKCFSESWKIDYEEILKNLK